MLLVPWLTSGCTALQSCQHLPVLSLLPRRVQGQLLLRAHCIHAGAGEAWFHLMQLLLPPASGPAAAAEEGHIQRLAAALNDFVQASSLGQLAQRLQLLHSFRYGPDWAWHSSAAAGMVLTQVAHCLQTIYPGGPCTTPREGLAMALILQLQAWP